MFLGRRRPLIMWLTSFFEERVDNISLKKKKKKNKCKKEKRNNNESQAKRNAREMRRKYLSKSR
jgi:hypothetical protein